MSQSRLLRFGISLIVALAMSVGVVQFALPSTAHADTIDSDDLLPDDFREGTGLGDASLETATGQIIRVFISFLGIVAVVIILFGGFKWMTAGGNEDKVQEAKRLIIAGIIGLAIILSAYAIASFVIEQLISATTE